MQTDNKKEMLTDEDMHTVPRVSHMCSQLGSVFSGCKETKYWEYTNKHTHSD